MADKMMRVAGRSEQGLAKALLTDDNGRPQVVSGDAGAGLLSFTIDLSGKVSGREFDNPNYVGELRYSDFIAPNPDNYTEITSTPYKRISELDGELFINSTNVNGYYMQLLFSFNILESLKIQGFIPGDWKTEDLAKVIKRLDYGWVGNGESGATLKRRGLVSDKWIDVTTNQSGPSTELSGNIVGEFTSSIDENGRFHFLVHDNAPSDGLAQSILRTDYVYVTVHFGAPYKITDQSRTYDNKNKASRVVLHGDALKEIESLNSKQKETLQQINDLSDKVDRLAFDVKETANSDGVKGIITELPKYDPVRNYKTADRYEQQNEFSKSLYLYSETELSDGTATNWYPSIGGAEVEVDTEIKESGESSLKVIASGDTSISIQKHLPNLNFENDSHIRAWIAIDDIDKLESIRIGFDAPDNQNQFNFNFANNLKSKGILGRPTQLTMHKKGATTYGNPSWGNITRMFIAVRAQSGETVTAWVDNVKMQRNKNTKGKIIIRFDDGLKSQYDVARPVMETYGIPASIFVNPTQIMNGVFDGGFGQKPTMSIEELKYLQLLGWDISSHMWDHKSFGDKPYMQAYNAARATQNWLIENGFEAGSRFHVFPNNSHNPDVLQAIKDVFLLDNSFSSAPLYETLPWGGRHIKRIPGDNTDLETLINHVDEVADRKGLGVMLFHRFEQEGNADFSVDKSVWNQFIYHLAFRDDVDAITFSDLVDGTPIATR